MVPCGFKSLLGLDCPTCGGQRSLLLLVKGDFAGSFYMYPPLLPVLLLVVLFCLHLLSKKIISGKSIRVIASVVLAIVMINYITHLIVES